MEDCRNSEHDGGANEIATSQVAGRYGDEDYPEAPKGGSLILGADGSFDSLNPFAVKGVAPVLVSSLMFQELGDSPLDEAFTKYPTLAESFKLADDKLSMDVKLNKDARFSDGKPVTADDLIFTFKMLMSEKAPPFYRFYYADIKELVSENPSSIDRPTRRRHEGVSAGCDELHPSERR